MAGARSFVIRQVMEERVPAILDFHTRYLTEHIWPRTLDVFRDLAQKECLFEAVERSIVLILLVVVLLIRVNRLLPLRAELLVARIALEVIDQRLLVLTRNPNRLDNSA